MNDFNDGDTITWTLGTYAICFGFAVLVLWLGSL